MDKSNFKTANILRCATYTIVIYVTIFLLVAAVYSWYLWIFYVENGLLLESAVHRFGPFEAASIVFTIGVAGVLPMFGGSSVLFLFTFAPLVFSLALIYIIVFLLEKKRLLSDHKKYFYSYVAFVVIISVMTTAFGLFFSAKHQIKAKNDRQQYADEYETKDPVKTDITFIYPENGDVITSGAYGEDKKILYSTGSENIGYVSPGGTYYVECESYEYGDCKTLKSRIDKDKNIDMCMMNSQHNEMICPHFCQWNEDGSRMVCEYEAARLIVGETTLKMGRALVYINPATGTHKILASRENPEYDSGFDSYTQDFAFISNDSIIYLDKEKFFRIDDMDVAEKDIKSVPVTNLSPCQGFIFNESKLICAIDAEKANIPIQNKENFFVSEYKTMLVSQTMDQVDPTAFSVITKAPFVEPEFMFTFGNYIMYDQLSGAMKIVDLQQGRARDFGGDFAWDVSIDSDNSIIFAKQETDLDKRTVPLPYRPEGDGVAPVGIVDNQVQSGDQSLNTAQANMVKFENERFSFQYNSNMFIPQNDQSSMINLKDVATGSNYADVSSYKIENGLTYDMIYKNAVNSGCGNGYCNVAKIKIGNREFIRYTHRDIRGANSITVYETVINGKYNLQVSENFSGHQGDEKSDQLIRDIAASVWVKEY